MVEREVMANPLISRDYGLDAYARPVEAMPATAAPNPLLAPPIPYGQMTYEQQMAWRDRETAEAEKQSQLRNAALDQITKLKKQDLDAKTSDQANTVISRIGELDPKDLDKYQTQRTKLLQENPFALNDPRVQGMLEPYDLTAENVRKLREEESKLKTAGVDKFEANRQEQAFKLAEKLGSQVLSAFNAEYRRDPEAAIENVTRLGVQAEQANAVAQLRDLGMSDATIKERYTGPQGQFLSQAATADIERGTKTREKASTEEKRDVDTYRDLAKARRDADYDPTDESPNPSWSAEDEAIYNAARRKASAHFPATAIEPRPVATPVVVPPALPPVAPVPVVAAPTIPAFTPRPTGIIGRGAPPPAAPARRAYPEGTIVTNPKSRQKQVMRGGKWEAL